jgi:hypothetical protein
MMVAVAGVQFYATLRAAVSVDPPPASAQILAVVIGVLAIAAAVVLLIRVGYLRDRAPFEVGRTGAKWVAWAGLGGAVVGFAGQMDAEWYIAGPINLIISLLAFAVAYSEPPPSARDSLAR